MLPKVGIVFPCVSSCSICMQNFAEFEVITTERCSVLYLMNIVTQIVASPNSIIKCNQRVNPLGVFSLATEISLEFVAANSISSCLGFCQQAHRDAIHQRKYCTVLLFGNVENS